MAAPILCDLVEDFNFIVRSFQVVLGTFLHLDSNIAIILQVFSEPDCREVTPAKFLNDDVPVHQDLAHVDWMVASNLVVRHALILATILVVEERVIDLLLQRCEV